MRPVPYRRIPGLSEETQRQLDRDFDEAAKQLADGTGNVRVPYTKIPGLPPEAQRQIDRNFLDLACDCAQISNPGTILTSEDFSTGYSGVTPDINGHALDLYLGGTANTWVATASGTEKVRVVTSGGTYAEVTGGAGGDQTGNAVLGTALGVSDMQVQATQNPSTMGSLTATFGVYARYLDANNYLWAQVMWDGTKRVLTFGKKVGGSTTTYQTVNSVSFGTNGFMQIITKGSLMVVSINSVSYFQNDVLIPTDLTGQKAGFYLRYASLPGCDNFAVYSV